MRSPDSADVDLSSPIGAIWFYNQVKTGGPWDFKNGPYPNAAKYDPFGNFHYGAAGHAFGWGDWELQNEAGIANGPGAKAPPDRGSSQEAASHRTGIDQQTTT